MKKIVTLFILFFSFLFAVNITNAQTTNSLTTRSIYENCEKTINKTNIQNSIKANIEDVKNERKLRQCLKNKIIQISSTFIEKTEIENIKETIDNIEKDNQNLYRIIIFCQQNKDTSWCQENYSLDTSLGKLILEKSITSEMYRILEVILDAKNDGFRF